MRILTLIPKIVKDYPNSVPSSFSSPQCLLLYSWYSTPKGTKGGSYLDAQYAILPEMNNLAGKQITLFARTEVNGTTFKIGMLSDPSDASTFEVISEQVLTTSYQAYDYYVPTNATAKYIAFMMESADADTPEKIVFIDNITIQAAPTCLRPVNVYGTANYQSVTLNWDSNASSWQVAHSTDANANPDNCIVGNAANTTFTVDNLTLDADHYFWVRALCGGNDQSPWTYPLKVHTGYCIPVPSDAAVEITNVTFGSGNAVVDNNTHPDTYPYYADFSTLIGAVQAGIPDTISISY